MFQLIPEHVCSSFTIKSHDGSELIALLNMD